MIQLIGSGVKVKSNMNTQFMFQLQKPKSLVSKQVL